MAHLRFAVLFAAASAVLLLAASPSPSPPPAAAVYVVGDEMGWAVPPAGATGALNAWAARHRFLVGDILLFRYTAGNDGPALLVPRDGYERCSAASPPSPFAGGGGISGVFGTFMLGLPGPHYFISGAPWRCEAGERMAVFVEDPQHPSISSGAPTPAPAPAPGTTRPPDTPPPPPFRHRRLSLAQKEFAAAAIGFGAGFVLMFFILFLCVCFGS